MPLQNNISVISRENQKHNKKHRILKIDLLNVFYLSQGIHGLPRRNGKIPDLSSFDADYFGTSSKQVDRMDPQLRLLLEVAYEAIFDSGNELAIFTDLVLTLKME